MSSTQNYLELIRRYVQRRMIIEFSDEELGKLAIAILNALLSKGEMMTDDKLASIVGYNVVDVRKVLQVLYDMRLVSILEEFNEAAGKIDQAWVINDENIRRFLINLLSRVLDKINALMAQLTNTTLYICPLCYKRYTEDDALANDYKCPLDNTPLVHIDPSYLAVLAAVESRLKKILDAISKGGG